MSDQASPTLSTNEIRHVNTDYNNNESSHRIIESKIFNEEKFLIGVASNTKYLITDDLWVDKN